MDSDLIVPLQTLSHQRLKLRSMCYLSPGYLNEVCNMFVIEQSVFLQLFSVKS